VIPQTPVKRGRVRKEGRRKERGGCVMAVRGVDALAFEAENNASCR